MKSAAKRRAPRRKSKATPSLARLPVLSGPVTRGVSADPWRRRIMRSNDECAACIRSCGTLGGHLRSMCENLCLAVCTA